MVVIAPRLTRPYHEDLERLGITALPQEAGIWRLQGGIVLHPTWVLETEVLAGLNHPLLTLVSPNLLAQPKATYQLLRQGGYTEMMVYLGQQVQQFRLRGEEFAMQHLGAEDQMEQLAHYLWESMSPEHQREELKRFAREMLEERLKGLAPEDVVRALRSALSSEQLEGLRVLLQQKPPTENGPSRPNQ